MSEIPQDCQRKPDPDEPWRYVCPDCDRQVWGQNSSRLFRCHGCKRSFSKRELKDLKGRIHG